MESKAEAQTFLERALSLGNALGRLTTDLNPSVGAKEYEDRKRRWKKVYGDLEVGNVALRDRMSARQSALLEIALAETLRMDLHEVSGRRRLGLLRFRGLLHAERQARSSQAQRARGGLHALGARDGYCLVLKLRGERAARPVVLASRPLERTPPRSNSALASPSRSRIYNLARWRA